MEAVGAHRQVGEEELAGGVGGGQVGNIGVGLRLVGQLQAGDDRGAGHQLAGFAVDDPAGQAGGRVAGDLVEEFGEEQPDIGGVLTPAGEQVGHFAHGPDIVAPGGADPVLDPAPDQLPFGLGDAGRPDELFDQAPVDRPGVVDGDDPDPEFDRLDGIGRPEVHRESEALTRSDDAAQVRGAAAQDLEDLAADQLVDVEAEGGVGGAFDQEDRRRGVAVAGVGVIHVEDIIAARSDGRGTVDLSLQVRTQARVDDQATVKFRRLAGLERQEPVAADIPAGQVEGGVGDRRVLDQGPGRIERRAGRIDQPEGGVAGETRPRDLQRRGAGVAGFGRVHGAQAEGDEPGQDGVAGILPAAAVVSQDVVVAVAGERDHDLLVGREGTVVGEVEGAPVRHPAETQVKFVGVALRDAVKAKQHGLAGDGDVEPVVDRLSIAQDSGVGPVQLQEFGVHVNPAGRGGPVVGLLAFEHVVVDVGAGDDVVVAGDDAGQDGVERTGVLLARSEVGVFADPAQQQVVAAPLVVAGKVKGVGPGALEGVDALVLDPVPDVDGLAGDAGVGEGHLGQGLEVGRRRQVNLDGRGVVAEVVGLAPPFVDAVADVGPDEDVVGTGQPHRHGGPQLAGVAGAASQAEGVAGEGAQVEVGVVQDLVAGKPGAVDPAERGVDRGILVGDRPVQGEGLAA
ncbi:MAG: hypothetical protein BWY73_00224 [candidate division TA06 bacterium ADurb.Bin417]|uniref:Uncharacterized protein n=1 Tax=candidate division TA06 bacterium ADurb.Bin417 TaxID=1852828 RepID=A0A1V5MLA0_UNCT6|nr:MAG: hypothetical protein BWY73_00224 [candidate division TA06 bacterium ADurb.Bin417]